MESSSPTTRVQPSDAVGLLALPIELLLVVVAKLERPGDVLALAGTCREIRWVLRSMAMPCVELQYPKIEQTTLAQERQAVEEQLRLLTSIKELFQRGRFVIRDRHRKPYDPALLFLRDTICRGQPHLFIPIASTLTLEQILSPMNGSTLERMAQNRGHTKILEYIQARRQAAGSCIDR